MADLLDIVTATAATVVRIKGERIVVRGLNAPAFASIAARFPEFRKFFSGGVGGNIVPLLFEVAGASVGPIIAAGTGHPGEEEYERHFSTKLVMGDQAELLTAILGLTFPNGLAAFLEKMNRLGGGEKEKTIKVRWRKSPSASPTSSDAASRPTMQ